MRLPLGVVLAAVFVGCAPIDDDAPSGETADEATSTPAVRVFADETNVRTQLALYVESPLAVEFEARPLDECGDAPAAQRIAQLSVVYQYNAEPERRAGMRASRDGWYRARLRAPTEAGRLALRFEARNADGCVQQFDNDGQRYMQPISALPFSGQ